MFHTLPVRGRQSHLVWPWEKSSVKIWPLPILDLYGQYVYQMKAENILNSNLTLISKICCIKVGRSQLFMISPHFQWEIFFRNANFLKIFINTPQFFFSFMCSQDNKLNLHQFWYPYLDHRQNAKQSKSLSLKSTPPH